MVTSSDMSGQRNSFSRIDRDRVVIFAVVFPRFPITCSKFVQIEAAAKTTSQVRNFLVFTELY